MSKTAQATTVKIIDIASWKAQHLIPNKRIDSDRLIERGKDYLYRIRQSPGTTFERLSLRVFQRCIAICRSLYPADQNISEALAHHISKSFSLLLENPEYYYGFFDFIVYQGKDIPGMLVSANGCLLTAALYCTPPWEVFEPELSGFYTRWGNRLFCDLNENRCRSPAIKLLSDERYMRKAVEAVVNLFSHPSKI